MQVVVRVGVGGGGRAGMPVGWARSVRTLWRRTAAAGGLKAVVWQVGGEVVVVGPRASAQEPWPRVVLSLCVLCSKAVAALSPVLLCALHKSRGREWSCSPVCSAQKPWL